ncbi:MAG: lamin tail domain-containing protein [Phycisphaerae bacterium]|nr:lamin tail domain-containing protein [Phycisphaerae bacterium]
MNCINSPIFETLEPRLLLSGSVVISEFMAINDSTLQDGDNQYSDWLEIQNTGTSLVDLTGWTLKDKNDSWGFPDNFELGPGEYKIIFCSNGRETVPDPKDPDYDGTYHHTNFKLSGNGEYLGILDETSAVVHEYDEYPKQFENISYGIAQDITTTEFVASKASARYLVATGNPGAWTGVNGGGKM